MRVSLESAEHCSVDLHKDNTEKNWIAVVIQELTFLGNLGEGSTMGYNPQKPQNKHRRSHKLFV